MYKKTTININKNGFKPFFRKSHLMLSVYYRFTYNDFEAEKRLKKDVLYAIRTHFGYVWKSA